MTTTTTTRPTARPTNARHLYPGRCGGFNEWVRDLAQSLMTTTPPAPEGIMSHHGLHFPWRGLTLTVAPHGPGILISMERNLYRCDWKEAHGRDPMAKLKARTWKRLRAAAALAFGKQIETEWNTGAGTSTSMTIAIPQGMAWMHNAVANYGNLPSVFDYDKATAARFEIVSGWHKGLLAAHTLKPRTPVLAYWKIDKASITPTATPTDRLTIAGKLFRPLDFAPDERPIEFTNAMGKLNSVGRLFFADEPTTIETAPNPHA